ncbi:peroxiredoxin [Mangrovimicrobium sediminis]|uniref:thioredoxin-dependent peroxiredoxin n=1 Tax=Mangrovimicrobium sediminis TaxID=2562682 RepID=A0A4Z0LZK9_9GAMM|nr:peroxiredoxin [Haliea sp. SAOS-164]
MRRAALSAVFALSLHAQAALDTGASAPLFTAPAALDGKAFEYSLAAALEQGAVVVYFYPSAYTGGCNVQAHEFSTSMAEFEAAGASVIGVSLDSIERLEDFSADPDYCAGKLAVASDADGAIARSYDLQVREGMDGFKDSRGVEIDHGFAERVTFIVTPDGKVARTIGGVSPADNVRQSLEAVRELGGAADSAQP